MALNKADFEGATYVAIRVDDKKKAWLATSKDEGGNDVTKDTPGAVLHTWEDRETKEMKSRYELRFTSIEGIVSGIEVRDGQFGTEVLVSIVDDKTYTLQAGLSTKWGQILLQKLPAVELGKKYTFLPYSIKDDKKEDVYNKAVVIKNEQGDKLGNFYYDAESKKNINGLPEVDEKNKPESKDEWKLFFAQQNIFMAKQLKARFGGKGIIVEAEKGELADDEDDVEQF